MAPEVIMGEEHTPALDFWSLGVIAYEFMTSMSPFNDATADKVFENIMQRRIKFPPVGREEDQMSPEAFDFINRLLCLDPK
jgi:serine/threonine protein kinase